MQTALTRRLCDGKSANSDSIYRLPSASSAAPLAEFLIFFLLRLPWALLHVV